MSPATPPLRKRSADELMLCMSAGSFLRKAWPDDLPFAYIPNGEIQDEARIRKALAMGMRAGISDYHLPLPNAQSAWLEAKDDDGVQHDAQITFMEQVRALKSPYLIFRSIPQLQVICSNLLAAFGRELKPFEPYQPRYVSRRFG